MKWAVPAVAVLMLGLTLAPAEIWRSPTNDAIYKGFDANLMYANNGGGDGRVIVSPASTELLATPGSKPSLNLATTPLRKLAASVGVTLSRSDMAEVPFRLGVWSPKSAAGYFVVFEPKGLVVAETVANVGPLASTSDVVSRRVLGTYTIGRPYRVVFLVDRAKGVVTSRVSGDAAGAYEDSVNSRDYPLLFSTVRLTLTASAVAGEGTSDVMLDDYSLTLPHERFWASKIDDPRARAVLTSLGVLGLVLFGVAIAMRLSSGMVSRLRQQTSNAIAFLLSRMRKAWGVLLLGSAGVCLYLAGNALLFPLGNNPFDMGCEKLYAYVARTYGVADLYYLPNAASLAKIWGGMPVQEFPFPYGPTFAYLFAGIGWLNSLLFAGGGLFVLDTARLEYLIKTTNVLFGLGDSVLIYLILRKLRIGERWSLFGSAFFLFNPAVWFSMSVWGQTHVISIFFVLAAVWFAEKDRPAWAWVALVAALMTRPQMVVFGLLMGIVLLRKFSWERNLAAISWTTIVTFVGLMPLTLATSPSLPVDIMLNNFHIQEAGGNDDSLTTVSQGAFSIWPLITYLTHGASGLQRTFMPSSQSLLGPVTYQLASQVLTVGVVLVLSAALLVRKKDDFKSGDYLLIVALGIASFLMLLTGIVSTHFLLALPFFVLCRRWMGSGAYLFVAVIWTVTSLVAMFGEVGTSSQLAPGRNALTRFVVELYHADRFISVAVAANTCAVVWLGLLTFRQFTSSGGSPKSPAPLGSPLSEPA